MAKMKASIRPERGTRQMRRLREKGLTPAIIYGHKETPEAVTISEHDLELALQHGERVLEVDVDGKKQNVLIKDVQWDTFGHMVLHVDLWRVSLDERVEITVTVVLRGSAPGEEEGGVVQQPVVGVLVECPVVSIPDEFRVSINELQLNESLTLGDIELPEGIKLLDDPETTLCTCSMIAEEPEEEEVGEEAAEPELIGETPEEGEGEGEEGGEEE